MVFGGIERGSGSGLGFMRCVDQEKVVAMTSEVVANGIASRRSWWLTIDDIIEGGWQQWRQSWWAWLLMGMV